LDRRQQEVRRWIQGRPNGPRHSHNAPWRVRWWIQGVPRQPQLDRI